MKKILGKRFFNRDTETVAKELLGKFLVRKIGNKEIPVMIVETEAYDGPHDRASHAFLGKTQRTEVMFGHPGNFYVYLCYGMYFMLNIVTREYGYPAAVLIRGAAYHGGEEKKVILDGPGKITKFLGVDKNLNRKKSEKQSMLWIEDRGLKTHKNNIRKTFRVGVGYAGPLWSVKKLRFFLDTH